MYQGQKLVPWSPQNDDDKDPICFMHSTRHGLTVSQF